MNTSQALIEEIRRIKGLTSDYQAAEALEVTRQTVSSWRKGRTHMDPEIALRAAELTGQDPLSVIAALEVDRTHSPEMRAFWGTYAKKFNAGGRLAALLLAISIGSGITTPISANERVPSPARSNMSFYTLCEVLGTEPGITVAHYGRHHKVPNFCSRKSRIETQFAKSSRQISINSRISRQRSRKL